jgi:hypothetical protein
MPRSTNIISQLMSSNPLISLKKTPTIMEENEIETQSIPSPPPPYQKTNVCVERLSMSQVHDGQSQQQQIFKENTNNR